MLVLVLRYSLLAQAALRYQLLGHLPVHLSQRFRILGWFRDFLLVQLQLLMLIIMDVQLVFCLQLVPPPSIYRISQQLFAQGICLLFLQQTGQMVQFQQAQLTLGQHQL